MDPTIDVASEITAQLGECPVWSEAEQALYWEDIDGRAIHRLEPSTGVTSSSQLSSRPGSFVQTGKVGRFLVGTEHELAWFDFAAGAEGTLTPWMALEEAGTGNRLNDGRCDPAGRYVVGSMFEDANSGTASGILHQVTADGVGAATSLELERDIGVSNGLVFDEDRARMYFTDTHSQIIRVWDYDLDSGERRNERVFVDYHDLPGYPDGACLDADGCYWSASIFGSRLTRFSPDGKVDRAIDLPLLTPTMPAFGGANLDTMYVTSLEHDRKAPQAEGGVQRGALLAIDAGVQGVPEPTFAWMPD